jgi:glutamyl-tRNA reductase
LEKEIHMPFSQNALDRPDVMPTIVSLREHLETIRRGEIDRFRGRLGKLSSEQQNALESLTCGIVNTIMRIPMTVLTERLSEEEFSVSVEMVHRIFDLGKALSQGGTRCHI